MLLQSPPTLGPSLERIVSDLLDGIVQAIPKLLSGLLFLIVAYLAIKLVLTVVAGVLDRVYPEDQTLIVNLSVLVVALFLWFGAGLTLLNIVGMEDIAASLETATGFIGLGIAFALKEMIADTVAGVYLLRDSDSNIGDRVDTASVTGEVTRIDLRKTRIRDETGDLIVVSNRDIEKKWTRLADSESE
jgi:small-conductance mechanosensitive channel